MTRMTRIAVWGASGFAGARLCDAAPAHDLEVRRLTRAELDFESGEARMREALAGVEVAYHCAGKLDETDPGSYAAATARFARACAAAGVRRLVYLSTLAVYGPRRAGEIRTDTPLTGADAYAASRIEAEVAVHAALTGTATLASIVRVPMLVGEGMPGTALRRFFGALRLGVFPHPGPEDATLPCLGIRRLAALLLRLPRDGNATLQFSDNLRWTELADRYGELKGRRIARIRLPALPGPLAAFSSTARYADDSSRVVGGGEGLPSTWPDIEALIRP